MKLLTSFLLIMGTALSLFAQPVAVSENNRYLVDKDGKPFFWLGDTAWELFHRLDREEATTYLEDRANKGFNVVQAVVLAEIHGLDTPNPYGHVPLIDRDPTKPNEDYFKHVDFIVEKAAELGITIGMLPTWGDKWVKRWGVGPEIFNPENAEKYGEYIGKRYRGQANIVWILGGDRNPDNETHYAIIRAMAKGIEKGDRGNHLMTFHPQGGASSSQFFHEDEWLDFNMFQSGHGQVDYPNYNMTIADYEKTPTKPVLDGEPRYENIPIHFNINFGRHPDFSVRRAAYASLFSGAFGHTYGNNNIWQMYAPDKNPTIWARTPWYDAIKHPGAAQMGYARKLLESRNFHLLQRAQDIIQMPKDKPDIRAVLSSDGNVAMVYIPEGQTVKVDIRKINGTQLQAWWFNPREGYAEKIGAFEKHQSAIGFVPPSQGVFNDWVLVLDSSETNFNEPGK